MRSLLFSPLSFSRYRLDAAELYVSRSCICFLPSCAPSSGGTTLSDWKDRYCTPSFFLPCWTHHKSPELPSDLLSFSSSSTSVTSFNLGFFSSFQMLFSSPPPVIMIRRRLFLLILLVHHVKREKPKKQKEMIYFAVYWHQIFQWQVFRWSNSYSIATLVYVQ